MRTIWRGQAGLAQKCGQNEQLSFCNQSVQHSSRDREHGAKSFHQQLVSTRLRRSPTYPKHRMQPVTQSVAQKRSARSTGQPQQDRADASGGDRTEVRRLRALPGLLRRYPFVGLWRPGRPRYAAVSPFDGQADADPRRPFGGARGITQNESVSRVESRRTAWPRYAPALDVVGAQHGDRDRERRHSRARTARSQDRQAPRLLSETGASRQPHAERLSRAESSGLRGRGCRPRGSGAPRAPSRRCGCRRRAARIRHYPRVRARSRDA